MHRPPFVRTAMPPPAQTPPIPDEDTSRADSFTDGYAPMLESGQEELQLLPAAPAPAPMKMAHRYPKRPKGYKDMDDLQLRNPEGYAAHQQGIQDVHGHNDQWISDHPRSVQNILDHWHQTTPEHLKQGMSWYADAHAAAKQIAADKGISLHQAAGLIANYSPQQHWAQNLRMASLAAGGQRIGGKKTDPNIEGFMASDSQADAAARILAGENYHDIFAGKKINAFGDLIEHGGDFDPDHPQVVIDRHALAVAHGDYADEGIYQRSGVSASPRKDGSSPVYDEVSQMYKDAADHINANGGLNGVMVAPHQLQAATWLTRQRLNAEGGYDKKSQATAKRSINNAISSTNKWNEYASVNHPSLVNKVPGTGFSDEVGQGGMQTPPQAPPGLSQVASVSYQPPFVRRALRAFPPFVRVG